MGDLVPGTETNRGSGENRTETIYSRGTCKDAGTDYRGTGKIKEHLRNKDVVWKNVYVRKTSDFERRDQMLDRMLDLGKEVNERLPLKCILINTNQSESEWRRALPEMQRGSENREPTLLNCSDPIRLQERAQNMNGFIDLSPFNQYNDVQWRQIFIWHFCIFHIFSLFCIFSLFPFCSRPASRG